MGQYNPRLTCCLILGVRTQQEVRALKKTTSVPMVLSKLDQTPRCKRFQVRSRTFSDVSHTVGPGPCKKAVFAHLATNVKQGFTFHLYSGSMHNDETQHKPGLKILKEITRMNIELRSSTGIGFTIPGTGAPMSMPRYTATWALSSPPCTLFFVSLMKPVRAKHPK